MARAALLILGIHCSVRGGYLAALEEARGLACGAMQMFSYRRHREPDPRELEAFRSARAASDVRRLLIHVRFLPFLASANAERRRRSVRLLERELRLARELGAEGLIVHAGAHSLEDDAAKGLERFAAGAAEAWSRGAPNTPLILENVPGGGRRMGGPLEQLAELGERLERAGVPSFFCLDTAHAWAQGYDIASAEGMRRFLGRADRLLGAARLAAFHLNDTRAPLGSHREHHWHWGKGRLGLEGLRFLVTREELGTAVGILETPKGSDRENLALARGLA